ncbi:MAG: hypothetical protein K1X28_05785 [Parachlamydiales bacterium]|nr:hypothetical protein [Parachlamydiales bacterium]
MSAMRVKFFLLLILGSLFSQEEGATPDLPVQTAELPAIESPEMVADAKNLLGSLFGAKTEQKSEDGYIINYTTVSIIEYIRFASKICKVNFIYQEADLNFTITVVSDEPVTSANVMATLIQVLRIHDLLLLEQGNSLVIHKAPGVKQLATLVTENDTDGTAPIVTRIFRIKNARPESIAAVVQPMISSSASMEVSSETKQLIVTDITANVNKIAALIENLDSPHTTLEIQKYITVHNPPEYLVRIGSQIMNPIAQGNPFILVPQDLAHEIFIVSTPELAAKAIEVFASLDSAPKEKPKVAKKVKPEDVFVYKILYRPGSDVLKGLSDIAENLQETDSSESDLIQTIETAKWIRETNSIMFVGSKSSMDKIREFLSVLDIPGGAAPEKISFFIYKPTYKNPDEVRRAIGEMADNLKGTRGIDESLIETIRSAKVNPLTHTITFSGPEKDFSRIKELLATIDTASAKPAPIAKPEIPPSTQFYIYKPQHQTGDQINESLKELTSQLKSEKLADPGLIHTLDSMKWVKSTHSLLFTGDPDSLKKVQNLIATVDIPGPAQPTAEPKTFYQYAPKYADEKRTENYLAQVSEDLSKKGGSASLIETLKTAKYIPESRTFMFFGAQKDLNQVQTLLTTFDVPGLEKAKPVEKTFIQYHPKYADERKTENYLKQVTQNLAKKSGSETLVESLKSYKWIPESRSFMFYGSKQDLDQVQGLLTAFDTPETETKPQVKPGYYIYKVQHTTGDVIEEDLDSLAKNLKATGVKESPLLDVIEKMRYVKQTNSLVLSGDPKGIEEAKQLLEQYDYAREVAAAPTNTNFFMYKPVHLPARQIEKSLRELGTNLKGAGLADPSLLHTIDTSKYVDSTNTLVFTGSSDTLSKIQGMIKEVDIPPAVHAPIQHVGKTTFLLYKLKNAGGSQIVSSIKNMTSELKKSGTADKDFLSALASIKYVKETNSLFFTGTEESLNKVQGLVEQFDVSSLAAPKPAEKAPLPPISGPGTYFVYKPQSLSGQELENILQNFAENLKSSGLVDDDLYRTINSIRWSDQTQTLIITGTQKSIDQVKDLLKEFDIPSNVATKPVITSPLEPSIQAIDNTSFLVYKLQFHKGDEIQNALRQIAKDLMVNNAPVNTGLLNSINSIQWLEVTNSLLCSGDQDTLTRLRELIKNLDIPLKQVFIEMLVIETSLANALNFGLEWGANYKYRNKFGAASYNTAATDNFLTNFENLTPPTEPSPFGGRIPPPPSGSGFDLGVIGEVIKHNGETFLTLGSLLTALQSDLETSIVMTPKILTQDGRTSTIFDGRNIPFVGSFVQNNSQTTVNTSNIEYRDIGLSLTVTPVLGNSDIVTLDINLDRTQTVGDVTGSINFNSNSAQGITTTKTSMQTTVHVPDNNFLVLSGMVNNSNVKSKVGIPCLGGLPLVGAAFSQNNDTVSNSNIVIFIRPHIINSIDEVRTITKNQEDYFRDLSGTPYLEQKYDEAMELIKTIDDD